MQYVIILIEIGATGMITSTSPHISAKTLKMLLLLEHTLSALPSACKAQEKQQLTFHKFLFPHKQQIQQTEFCNLD